MTKKLEMSLAVTVLLISILFARCAYDAPEIKIQVNENEKKVNVTIDDQLFTSYVYSEGNKKPVLWPVISPGGNAVTRSFPIKEKAGERTDHPHHAGAWFSYGNVNGLIFWGNSKKVTPERQQYYGTIYHRSIEKIESGNGKATLATVSEWVGPSNEVLLKEHSIFEFSATKNTRIIDRTTCLSAVADTILFKDDKEGLFAIRVARELELPSDEQVTLSDVDGGKTIIKTMDNTGVSGNCRSSEGIEGEDVWATRGRWMKLGGTVNGEPVSLIIIDHPGNVGYPTYWHARGYGLFAANPLGQNFFSNGKEELNYRLKKGESLDLKFRLVVASGNLTDDQINRLADEFAGKSKQKKSDWTWLFDGTSTDAWRSTTSDKFPEQGWKVVDGELTVLPKTDSSPGGKDIITKEQYSNFELEVEFKLTRLANSGIKYFVVNDYPGHDGEYLGLEYQLVDNVRHTDEKPEREINRRLASLYYLIAAPESKKVNPPGEWNKARIISDGQHVEHWLNGKKMLEYERGGDSFRALVAESKYNKYENFGEAAQGHILLQGHNDEVSFRAIKIRTW